MLKIKYTKSLKGSRKYVCLHICVYMYMCICSCVHMRVCSCKKQDPSQSNPTLFFEPGSPTKPGAGYFCTMAYESQGLSCLHFPDTGLQMSMLGSHMDAGDTNFLYSRHFTDQIISQTLLLSSII